IAVNCGAIPEGTIDSELFGHEKGSFTGATNSRKGYFEVANGGTIFLDEVAELPMATQVRLLRVLETGEYIRVGSSTVQKTDVRVVAASNVDIPKAVEEGKFREDLYYRLNTVPIRMPSLRERGVDIVLLFRRFAVDFAEKYKRSDIKLDSGAKTMLMNYSWPGNVRQLKNLAEQISIMEPGRDITADILKEYLPDEHGDKLPALRDAESDKSFASEREILYKILFDMKSDMNDLKKMVYDIKRNGGTAPATFSDQDSDMINHLFKDPQHDRKTNDITTPNTYDISKVHVADSSNIQDTEEVIEESLSLSEKEEEMIKKALEKNNGKRKAAAKELGISERTLYRKIKEYDIKL
ncbi:MAG: sigma-54-dependent Fis family transcriptional regulator, partial [Bacteroidales bacterium]|nr:sigma-54-dependent Fis family transcriptional regulator [Bacteroidales bacterium]